MDDEICKSLVPYSVSYPPSRLETHVHITKLDLGELVSLSSQLNTSLVRYKDNFEVSGLVSLLKTLKKNEVLNEENWTVHLRKCISDVFKIQETGLVWREESYKYTSLRMTRVSIKYYHLKFKDSDRLHLLLETLFLIALCYYLKPKSILWDTSKVSSSFVWEDVLTWGEVISFKKINEILSSIGSEIEMDDDLFLSAVLESRGKQLAKLKMDL